MCLKQGKCIKLLCIVIPGTYLDWLSAHQWVVSSNTWMQIKLLLEVFNYFVQQRPKPMPHGTTIIKVILVLCSSPTLLRYSVEYDTVATLTLGALTTTPYFPPHCSSVWHPIASSSEKWLNRLRWQSYRQCAVCTDMPPWTDILNESIFACSALRPAFLHPPHKHTIYSNNRAVALLMLATLFYWQTGSKEIIIRTDLINSAPSIEDKELTACVKTPALCLTVTVVALSATVICGPKMADSDKRVRKRNQEWDMSSLHSYWIKPMFFWMCQLWYNTSNI